MSNEPGQTSEPPEAANPSPDADLAEAPAAPGGDAAEAATPAGATPPPRAEAPAKARRTGRSLLGRVGEWFWRSGAIARADAVGAEERTRTRAVLELAEQRGEAAETLWTTGHLAEALRLAVDAFEIATQLPSDPERLRQMGALESDLERLERAQSAASATIPKRDGDLGNEHTERYLDLQGARRALLSAHGTRIATPRALRWQRVQRVGGVIVAALALVATAWLVFRTSPRVDVRASDQFPGAQYAPDNAFDDNESTEWVLPDGETGWIEGRLIPPRNIESIRVLNGRNSQFGDRAVKEYKVQLFRGGELLGEHEGVFERIESSPEWVEIPIGGQGASRIRFEALGYHRRGAALAEIAWDD